MKRTRLPLPLVIPLVSAAAVIGIALGLGLVLLEVNNEIGENEAIIAALVVTILIMVGAAALGRE